MKQLILAWTFLFGELVSAHGPGSSTDTSYWQTQSTTLAVGALHAVSAVDGNVCWIAGDSGKIIRTVDGGNTWSLIYSGTIGTQRIYALDGVSSDLAFASTTTLDTTRIYRTIDSGASWSEVFSQQGGSIFGIKMYNSTSGIAMGDPVGATWTIIRTTNGGSSWFRIPTEPLQTGGSRGGTRFGFFDTSWVWFFDSTRVNYYSTNGGQTWSIGAMLGPCPSATLLWWNNLYHPPPPAPPRLGLTATWPPAPQVICRWEDPLPWYGVGVPNCLLCAFVPMVALVGARGTREFWLLWDSVYYSPDAGSTWTGRPPNGLDKRLTSIDMVTLGSEVSAWATGIGDAVYHYHRVITGVEEYNQQIPQQFSLLQNYPNPFNPTTNIKFQVPSTSFVTLKVFDVLGREVATLVNEEMRAGGYERTFDGVNLASGIYIYRLQTSSVMMSRKLLLLR